MLNIRPHMLNFRGFQLPRSYQSLKHSFTFRYLNFFVPFSTTPVTVPSSDYRVAVVGCGPAGFYTTKYLLNDMKDHNVAVDMFDELPTPYGLVRSGVAPDHPEVKNVQKDFSKIASDERCRFLGNVRLGKDVSISELMSYYNAVVLSYGASSNRKLDIPGAELEGVYSARAFVNWYNGHPDHRKSEFNLDTCENAVVIGQGNVAVDVARILSASLDHIKETDITENAFNALSKSKIKNIFIVGRRGPAQAAFTIKEFRELTRLKGVQLILSPEEIEKGSNKASLSEVNGHRAYKRKFALIKKTATGKQSQNTSDKILKVSFFLNPSKYLSHNGDKANKVSSVEFDVTTLSGDAGSQKAVISDEMETIKADIVFESIGYKSVEVPGVPFNQQKGIVPNQGGRVVSEGADGLDIVDRLYVSGWLKRGPTGIIGTNIPDARETVKAMVEDLSKEGTQQKIQDEDIANLLKSRGVEVVNDEGWRKIDEEETKRGQVKGKPREKITNVEEMLEIARGV